MSLQIGSPPKRFQSTWDTTQAGSSNNQVVLPLQSAGAYSFQIDWGDGTSNRDTITAYDQAEVTHTYDSTGVYEIRIIGDITGWSFGGAGDDDKIMDISQWGPLRLIGGAVFRGCSNLQLSTTDPLILSNVTNMRQAFDGCNIGTAGNVGSWDVSTIERVRSMFSTNFSFNQDLSNWNTTNFGSISDEGDGMFNNCGAFNNGGSPGISGWDVSNWDNSAGMNYMFFRCRSFNQPLDGWDVTSVVSMHNMFNSTDDFNNGGSTGINNWRPSSCTNMLAMFASATSFNQPIGDWDVTGVTNMASMFDGATSFNNGGSTGINNWRPSSCTSMSSMFQNTSFNQPIGDWDTSSVNNFRRMFNNNNSFNQDIGNWDVSSVVGSPGSNNAFRDMFGSAFNNGGSSSISGWDVSNCRNFTAMFDGASSFNQDIGAWTFDNSYVGTSVDSMFNGASAFNNGGSPSISGWNISGFFALSYMFKNATSFNQPIGSWNLDGLQNKRITNMLENADAFDQDLSNWNVSNVTNATNFMLNASGLSTTNYDSTLGGWSPQSVQNGVSIHFGNSQYSTATGAAYRATLVSKGWTITDGGAV